jgi:hypothetical protein
MIWRIFSYIFLLIGIALLAAAAYVYYLESDAPGVMVENAAREFPDLIVGTNTVTYRLHNPTRHTVRVVGSSFCCGSNCRFQPKDSIPFDIPPGASADLPCILETIRPGSCETQVHLFFDDLGLREQTIEVRGTAHRKP